MLREIDFTGLNSEYTYIDVRSPSEFADGSIPGAINIPLLDDEARAAVGTTYKQVGKTEAKRLGVQLVAPRLEALFEEVLKLKAQNDKLVCFCARGGYRSTFFANIFSSIDLRVLKLSGGYKAYRQVVRDSLPLLNAEVEYIVLHGNTGVGKTNILLELQKLGCAVLDLEGAANHRGSLLGSIGLGKQHNQKTFESYIYRDLSQKSENLVFVEAESKRIGTAAVPEFIHAKMKASPYHVNIEASLDYRANSLKADYILNGDWQAETIKVLPYFKKHLNNEKLAWLEEIILAGDFAKAAKYLMVEYYDPMYLHTAQKYEYALTISEIESAAAAAQEIYEWLQSVKNSWLVG
ncbi:MAG: tRNA 2-selenouridine(34) synthase MnmH [Clostridia bacterium]